MITLEKIYQAMVFETYTDDSSELDEMIKQLKALPTDKVVSIILRDLEEFRNESFSMGVRARMKKVDLERIYDATVCAISAQFTEDPGLALYMFLADHEEVIKSKWPEGQKPVRALISALQAIKSDCVKEYKATGKMLEAVEITSDAIEVIESLSEEFKNKSVSDILIYEF